MVPSAAWGRGDNGSRAANDRAKAAPTSKGSVTDSHAPCIIAQNGLVQTVFYT